MHPTFKETLGKLYITEKLMKYKRNVLKVSFFPANLVSMFSRNKEYMKRKFLLKYIDLSHGNVYRKSIYVIKQKLRL